MLCVLSPKWIELVFRLRVTTGGHLFLLDGSGSAYREGDVLPEVG